MLPHAPHSPDMSPPVLDLISILLEPMSGQCFSFLEELSTGRYACAIRHINKSGVLDGIIMLPKRWDSVVEKQGDYTEGL